MHCINWIIQLLGKSTLFLVLLCHPTSHFHFFLCSFRTQTIENPKSKWLKYTNTQLRLPLDLCNLMHSFKNVPKTAFTRYEKCQLIWSAASLACCLPFSLCKYIVYYRVHVIRYYYIGAGVIRNQCVGLLFLVHLCLVQFFFSCSDDLSAGFVYLCDDFLSINKFKRCSQAIIIIMDIIERKKRSLHRKKLRLTDRFFLSLF